jgi:hypothetical protein
MVNKAELWTDLRYAGYVAAIVFFYIFLTYVSSQRLLAFWLGFLAAAGTIVVGFPVIVAIRVLGRLTGLNKPAVRVKERVRERVGEIVEELDEEIEKSG